MLARGHLRNVGGQFLLNISWIEVNNKRDSAKLIFFQDNFVTRKT